jgi:ketosteroid isomerase-like protein
MKHILFLFLFILLLSACTAPKPDAAQLEKEIVEAERAFAQMAAEKGIAEAFHAFAAEDAVIKRQNDTLIIGPEAIKEYYSSPFYQKAKVEWKPDYVKVDPAGNMAYTYGKFHWRSPDTAGVMQELRGVFHTVWQRQADGTWKYVWD